MKKRNALLAGVATAGILGGTWTWLLPEDDEYIPTLQVPCDHEIAVTPSAKGEYAFKVRARQWDSWQPGRRVIYLGKDKWYFQESKCRS